MRLQKLLIIFLLSMSGILAKAQGTWNIPDAQAFKFPTLQEALDRTMDIGAHVSIAEAGKGGDFVVISASSVVADGVRIINKGDGTCLLRETSQTMSIKAEWFGMVADGITDCYTGAQALATFVNNRHGYVNIDYSSLWYAKPVYKINVIKIQKAIGSDTTTNNGIVDINFNKDTNVHVFGGGAKIQIKGDFFRKTTAVSGAFAYSSYATVCPFYITDCNHFTIDDIELYGEVDKMSRPSNVTEGQCYGVKVGGSSYININNSYIHHFATDGAYFDVSGTFHNGIRWNCEHIEINNSKFWYNARQGLTGGSLNNLTALNSSFSHNGDSMGTYIQHAPSAGVDLEPIVAPPATNEYTRNIHFINCDFDNNVGTAVSAAMSVVKDVYLDGCHVDNRKFNNQYVFIFGIDNSNVINSIIYTGTGNIYPYWNTGETKQSARYDNNTIICGASGFLVVGTTPQYGLTISNNRIIGAHASSFNSYFPYISSVAKVTNNKFFLDSNLYFGTKISMFQFLAQASGNEFFSDLDTTGHRSLYASYAGAKLVTGEVFPTNGSVICYEAPNWPKGVPYTNGSLSGGSQINVNSGGLQESISWGMSPVTGQYYERGSIIYFTNPDAVGYSYLHCSVAGLGGSTAVFEYQGKIGGTNGRNLLYKNTVFGNVSQVGLPDSAIYTTRAANDTGMVLFKIPAGFTLASMRSFGGTITVRGKGQASWVVTLTTAGFANFQPTLNINGDSSLLTTKVRLLKDASNNAYIGFFDSSTIIPNVTTIVVNDVMLTNAGDASTLNAGKAWVATTTKTLSGFTILNNLTNTSGSLWATIPDKPPVVTALTLNPGSSPTLVNGTLNIPPATSGTYKVGDSAILNNPTAIQSAKFNIYASGGGNHIANQTGITTGSAVPPSSALDITLANANFFNVGLSMSVTTATSGLNLATTGSNTGAMSVGGYQAAAGTYRAQETSMSALEQTGGVVNIMGKTGLTAGNNYTLDKWGIFTASGLSLNGTNPTATINLKASNTTIPSMLFDLAGAVSKTSAIRGAFEVLPYYILFTDSTGLKDTLATRKWARVNSGTAQVNSDWNASTGVAAILNKPTIPAQVNLTAGTGISISGTYPNLTITNTGGGTGGGTEVDPFFTASPANGISGANIANWNTAYNSSITSGVYSSGTLTLNKAGGGTITVTGFSTGTGGGGGGTADTICNSIYNDVILQTGANFNIDGTGTVGQLAFNTPVTSGSPTDSIMTVTSGGAVHAINLSVNEPWVKGPINGFPASKSIIQPRNAADSVFMGGNSTQAFGKTNIIGNTNINGSTSIGVGAVSATNILTVYGRTNIGLTSAGTTTQSVVLVNPFFNGTSGQIMTGMEVNSLQSASASANTFSATMYGIYNHPQVAGSGVADYYVYRGLIDPLVNATVTGFANNGYIYYAGKQTIKSAVKLYQYYADSASTLNPTVYGFYQKGKNSLNNFDGASAFNSPVTLASTLIMQPTAVNNSGTLSLLVTDANDNTVKRISPANFMNAQHPTSTGSAPSISGTGTNVSAAINSTGKDASFRLTIVVSGGNAINNLCTVSFNSPWAFAPNVVATPVDYISLGFNLSLEASVSGIAVTGNLPPGTYTYNIICLQ